MKMLISAALMFCAVTPAGAQVQGKPIIVDGTCNSMSGVTIDDDEMSAFDCNTAVVARMQSGTVMIQFADKSGDDGRILGFAGTIEGKQGFGADAAQLVAVERLYLAGGEKPILVSKGTCIMNWSGLERTGGSLTSVVCGARGEGEGHDIRAMAGLETK